MCQFIMTLHPPPGPWLRLCTLHLCMPLLYDLMDLHCPPSAVSVLQGFNGTSEQCIHTLWLQLQCRCRFLGSSLSFSSVQIQTCFLIFHLHMFVICYLYKRSCQLCEHVDSYEPVQEHHVAFRLHRYQYQLG